MALEIQQFTENERKEWDEFVNHHPEGKFSQLIGYKEVIQRTYGYKAAYWLFRRPQGEIVAILPAFIKKSWLTGNKLISQPFCEYGGLLANNLAEEDNLLIKQELSKLLVQLKMPFLEVHGGTGLSQESKKQIFLEKPLHQYAVLRLTSSRDVWEKKMDRMVRKAVRKAERNNLECYQEVTEGSIKDDFYPLYLRTMKRFGTPPHSLSFFLNCLQCMPQYIKLFLVRYQGEVIATLLGFTTGKRVHIIVTASDEKHRDKRPNDLAHWEFIKWAAESGYEFFDFGPVHYAGQRQFKEKWGVEFHDYSYFSLSRQGSKLKTTLLYSNRARILAFLWNKLVPLNATRTIGPWFRKQLGD